MGQEDFEALLKRMPEIAEAVNSFESEALQREAFQALVGTFGHASVPTLQEKTRAAAVVESAPAKNPAGKKPRDRKGAYTPKLIKELDLAPAGKTAFRDFIAEKQPQSNEDKYAVAVYYLQHELEIAPITLDHIGSVFRLTQQWKEPKNLQSGITTAASRKGTIDTKDFEDIKTTPHGRNFVEHELPLKKKTK